MSERILFLGVDSRCTRCRNVGPHGATCDPRTATIEHGVLVMDESCNVSFKSREWLVKQLESGCRLIDWLTGHDHTEFANQSLGRLASVQ